MGQKTRIDAVYANDVALDKAGGVTSMMSAIGKTPGPLGTDHSPMFVRFSSPIAHPNDGSLPTVYSPPPAAPSRWGLDETGAQTYHDLLLRWSHDELLTELSTNRHTFVQARNDLFPLAQAASVLELSGAHDGQQIHEAAERATKSLRYTCEYAIRHGTRETSASRNAASVLAGGLAGGLAGEAHKKTDQFH